MTTANSDSQSNSADTSFLNGISPNGELILKEDLVKIIGYFGLFISFKKTLTNLFKFLYPSNFFL